MSNAPLRAALTDTSVPGTARQAVLLDLLEGKVSPGARRLAAFAALVVRAPEVPVALGWLSTQAWHAAEGREIEEPPLSLTQARQRVGGYATALHEDMSTAQLESLEDDLFRFGRIVASTPALRARADRPGPRRRRPPGARDRAAGGQGAGDDAGTGPLRRDRRPGPGLRGDRGLPGRADRGGPRLAHRPRARRGPDRRRAAGRPLRVAVPAGRAGRSSCRWSSTRRCSAAHASGSATCRWTRRHADGSTRCASTSSPPGGSRRGSAAPVAATRRQKTQREQTDGRADDRRQ